MSQDQEPAPMVIDENEAHEEAGNISTDDDDETAPTQEQHHEEDDEISPMDDDQQQSSYSQSKVSPPITLLQEICSRNGLTAEYQFLSTEGSVHEPTFKFALTVAHITVTASGQSKKSARHAAARVAIQRLRQEVPNLNFEGINFENITTSNEPIDGKSVYSIGVNEPNPVGKLQEICMKMRVNPPDYDTCNEKGLAHERVFMISCTIASLNMTTLGEGRSKKLAKRQAAEHMLSKLETSEIHDKAASGLKPGAVDTNTGSLYLDSDDNSNFVMARRLVIELCTRLDCSVKELWKNIQMIELDNVNEDLFYELIQDTVVPIGHCQFNYLTDTHCFLNIYFDDDTLAMTSFGLGKDNVSAMKNSVINAYKLLMAQVKPLIGKEVHLAHLEGESFGHQAATVV